MICPYVRPPAIEGVREARAADHVRALLWMLRGFAYEWKQSGRRCAPRRLARRLAAKPGVHPPDRGPAAQGPWSRYYPTPAAIIGVSATGPGDEWVLADQSCARSGPRPGSTVA